MSEYSVGDKVYLECEVKEEYANDNTYVLKYKNWLKSEYTTALVEDDVLHPIDESYNKGLNAAWELAKKIVGSPSNGGYAANELVEIFGTVNKPVLDAYAPQEALAKVKAYEERNEIKVGDVVKLKETTREAIVTRVTETCLYFLFKDGSCGSLFAKEDFEKTGKHFDSIDEFMKQED